MNTTPVPLHTAPWMSRSEGKPMSSAFPWLSALALEFLVQI